MKLVLLFFCGILITIITLLVLLVFSKIKLNIKKCNISNIQEGRKQKNLNKEFIIYIEFYLLGLIKIAKIRITKELMQKLTEKNDLKSIEKDVKIAKSIHIVEIIKKLKIKMEKLRMYLAFGTESVMLTVNLVALISAITRNNVKKC